MNDLRIIEFHNNLPSNLGMITQDSPWDKYGVFGNKTFRARSAAAYLMPEDFLIADDAKFWGKVQVRETEIGNGQRYLTIIPTEESHRERVTQREDRVVEGEVNENKRTKANGKEDSEPTC